MNEKPMSALARSIVNARENKVSPSTLTKITADWMAYFFQLKRYKSSLKLLKIVGPVAIGIELEKPDPSEYRPSLVLYNLIDPSEKWRCIIDQKIVDVKNLTVSIPYATHANEYEAVCKLVEQQSPINLFTQPALEEIISGIIKFTEYDKLNNSFYNCKAIMQFSRLLNDEQEREMVFNQGFELLKKKVPKEYWFEGIEDTEQWLDGIKSMTAPQIKAIVEEHIKKRKMEKFPHEWW